MYSISHVPWQRLFFGMRLTPEHRAALHDTAQLRRRQWRGEDVDEEVAAAEMEYDDRYTVRDKARDKKGGLVRSATLAAIMPLAVLLGLARSTSGAAATSSTSSRAPVEEAKEGGAKGGVALEGSRK